MQFCIWFTLTLTSLQATYGSEIAQQPVQEIGGQDDPFNPAFDAFVKATIEKLHVPGLSVAVVDTGKIYSKGYGYAHLPDRKATADTQYFTGSTTKAFVAAAAALLVHDDDYPDIRWTSPVKDLIGGDFALEDEHATAHTTIEDALSHRSGLPRHDLMYGLVNDTPASVVQRMRYLPMSAEPRTIWQYCNIMYAMIGHLLETIKGRKLETILAESFWKPLGMLSTTFTLPDITDKDCRLARGYYWQPAADEHSSSHHEGFFVPDKYLDLSPIAGAGAVISTVNDYALWIQALLAAADSNGDVNKSSPITYDIYRDVVTPRAIVSQDDYGIATPPLYALGWATIRLLGQTIVTHEGGLTGFGTTLYMLPDIGYGIVTMGNTADTSNQAGESIASHLILQKLNLGAFSNFPKSTVHQSLTQLPRISQSRSSKRFRQRNSLRLANLSSEAHTPLPLPVPLANFAGIYSHPAYGPINLTIGSSKGASGNTLEFLLYPRIWPQKVKLSHVSNTIFSVDLYQPHGLGDIPSGKDIVWEKVGEEFPAVFEFALDGETVETLGIELEIEVGDAAEKNGPGYWQEGLIWFQKM